AREARRDVLGPVQCHRERIDASAGITAPVEEAAAEVARSGERDLCPRRIRRGVWTPLNRASRRRGGLRGEGIGRERRRDRLRPVHGDGEGFVVPLASPVQPTKPYG